jgi:cysteine-rich repeat protein
MAAMRGSPGASLVLCLAVTAASVAGCGDDEPMDGTTLGQAVDEVLVGSFAARFDETVVGGGVVAQGASLSGREDAVANTTAAITIAGIPAGSSVRRALLYWSISGGTDTTATINATAVTGVQVAAAGETCWGAGVNNTTFRADVTAQVTGNGVYTIGGLPSSTTATAADTDGAALVVTYQNPTSGIRRRVMIRDGAITTSGTGEVVTDTFTGVAAPIASAGQFHLVVGDGQATADGNLLFNGGVLGASQFQGSDGFLWDTNSYNVTVPAGLANASWTGNTSNDCLVYAAAVVDWNVGVCGDAVRTGGEVCEQGNTTNGDGCSAQCNVEPGWNCTAAVPAVCAPICGDGVRVGTEQCDQGNTTNGDGCSSTCQIETGWTCTGSPSVCTTLCGDGVRAGAEQCDQGNTTSGDGCSATCQIEPGWTCTGAPSVCTTRCGDGIRAGAEQCDQGNVTPGDGCSATCTIEPGWTCTGSPSACTTTCGDGVRAGAEACDDGDTMSGDGCSNTCAIEPGWTCTGVTPTVCVTTCGDGVRAGAEACDDGGLVPGDGCDAVCGVEPGWTCVGSPSVCATSCGDGVRAGAEACDDGDTMSGDGCDAACLVEPGWTCVGAPLSVCTTTCGDNVIAGAETCDDGNTSSLDGCSSICATEPGWTCIGAPSRCTTTCGDGVIAGGEACDDGDTTAGDGCSATCAVEPGWYCLSQPSTCTTICGDGLVVDGVEECDDGGTIADDGCSATCTVERGWSCTGEPSTCTTGCGDGIVAGAEVCDDGDTDDGDGCSRMCTVETGWSCVGEPSSCDTECGDGIRVASREECDDANETSGDGCSELCAVEDGWLCEPDQGTETSTCQALSVAGGGCATGGGGGGLPLAALVIGLGLVVRRRRAAGAAVAAVALGAAAPTAMAQVVTGDADYSAERFQLAMDRRGVLGVEAPTTPGHLKLDVGFWLGYANDPLTVRVGDDNERLGALVSDRIGADLVASIGLGRRFEVGLTAPLILSQSDDLGMLTVASGSPNSFGLGDVTLTPKVALLDGSFAVALAAAIGLPTSGGASYFGDGGVTASPALLIGHHAGALRLLANLGYRVRPSAAMSGLAIDDELFARAGVGYRAGKADVMAELSFATPAAAPLDDYNANHAEARGGLGVDVVPGVRVFAAAGLGLAAGFGTPDWRALGGLWFGSKEPAGELAGPRDTDGDGIVDPLDKCVTEPETVNQFEDDDGCPDDPDPDHDGMIGEDDACPTEPETKNGFQDKDGCPDAVPDTDGDGLSDPADSCPTKAEDNDGYEDDDGCPDEDNDADTVLDVADRCPTEAGVVDNGGCPDGDRDGDTVVDRLDNCPDEPGTVKNFGCKDKQLVVFKGGTIELLDVVYFKTNKAIIEKRSFKLLRNVAIVINAHPEIKKVTVEGHTDTQGDDAYNKDLSQRRAAAVVEMLVANGVDGSLLEAIGYGEERPIADNRTKKGRAKNRRVEFVVAGITGNVQNLNSAPTGDTLE